MTQRDKLVARILAKPPDMDFEDVRRLLEEFGYTMRPPGRGSHRFFVARGRDPISVPNHNGRAKRAYLQVIIDALDLEN